MKVMVAFVLVLCLGAPFVFSAAVAYIAAAHTHACHDEVHGEDCHGTKECCTVCHNIDCAKIHPVYSDIASSPSLAHIPVPIALLETPTAVNTFYASLVSLKVRFNN